MALIGTRGQSAQSWLHGVTPQGSSRPHVIPTGAGHQLCLPRHPGRRDQSQQPDLPPGTKPSPQPTADTTYLIGAGPGEGAESLGPTHGGLQLAALGCGAGVHPHGAVADGETGLERRGKGSGLSSAC